MFTCDSTEVLYDDVTYPLERLRRGGRGGPGCVYSTFFLAMSLKPETDYWVWLGMGGGGGFLGRR